jgi:drug/metabolite transporter (DMT)-like permease
MRTVVIYSSSLFGAALAFFVLKEGFTAIQLIAGIVMLLRICILYAYGKRN